MNQEKQKSPEKFNPHNTPTKEMESFTKDADALHASMLHDLGNIGRERNRQPSEEAVEAWNQDKDVPKHVARQALAALVVGGVVGGAALLGGGESVVTSDARDPRAPQEDIAITPEGKIITVDDQAMEEKYGQGLTENPKDTVINVDMYDAGEPEVIEVRQENR